jgi:hypothetical protein
LTVIGKTSPANKKNAYFSAKGNHGDPIFISGDPYRHVFARYWMSTHQ